MRRRGPRLGSGRPRNADMDIRMVSGDTLKEGSDPDREPKIDSHIKKNLKKKALHTSGDTAEHTLSFCLPATPPPLSHSFPIPLSFFRPLSAFCGGMVLELRALQQPGLDMVDLCAYSV
eukprot:scaffold26372_cov120-Isochrysis_galbana.AAC.5